MATVFDVISKSQIEVARSRFGEEGGLPKLSAGYIAYLRRSWSDLLSTYVAVPAGAVIPESYRAVTTARSAFLDASGEILYHYIFGSPEKLVTPAEANKVWLLLGNLVSIIDGWLLSQPPGPIDWIKDAASEGARTLVEGAKEAATAAGGALWDVALAILPWYVWAGGAYLAWRYLR